MKSNIRHTIFGWLWVAALLLSTACTDTADLDASAKSVSGDNTVTFTVKAERSTVSTRAGEPDGTTDGDEETTTPAESETTIGNGKKVDVLIFAVYTVETDDDGNEVLTLAEEFQKNATKVGNVEAGEGQNVITVKDFVDTGYKFQMTTDAGKKYRVAFWAQNSGSKAYNTKDLTKVTVDYSAMKFNTDDDDAFCAVSEVIEGGQRTSEEVTLRRPLAQINVGTTGWDYEGAAKLHPSPTSYTESKLTVKGVARYYNVVAGRTLTTTDAEDAVMDTELTFNYKEIPAFIHLTAEQKKTLHYGIYPNEEFLKVDIDKNETYDNYVGYKAFIEYRDDKHKEDFDNGKLPATEVFKYLSTVYVLVPEAHDLESEERWDATKTYGSVLSSVSFAARGVVQTQSADGTDSGTFDATVTDDTNKMEIQKVFTINNVPVQKNWRTNILGNSFFITNSSFKIYIVPDYCGDFNNIDGEQAPDDGVDENHGGWMDDIHFDKPGAGSSDEWGLKDKDEDGNDIENGTPNEKFPAENPKYNDENGEPDKSGDMDDYYDEPNFDGDTDGEVPEEPEEGECDPDTGDGIDNE